MKQKIDELQNNQRLVGRTYILLPFLFLTVTLLGGTRFTDKGLVFLKPDLLFFMLAFLLLFSFFKAKLIILSGWLSDDFPLIKILSNLSVLLTVYTASVQIFNCLTPESGISFWIVSFCFFWILWNNLFFEMSTTKVIKSLIALFGFAFFMKYIILANLTAPATESWWQGFLQNPTKETITWLLELPRFSPITGYLQFLNLVIYLIALYLLPPSTPKTP